MDRAKNTDKCSELPKTNQFMKLDHDLTINRR